jgi:uncharacterized cupredoxin-like copper-binding protein
MFSIQSRRAMLIGMAMAVVLTACGSDTSSTTEMAEMEDTHEDEGHDEEFHFGEPTDAADADRTIEIEANDNLTFSPNEITVAAGETITFRVTNTGSIPHDFTLGDQETQDAHEAEMMEMMESGAMMMHDEANAVALEAGETKTVTWHFSKAGTVLIGCHQTGHYAAGMTGTVTVES